MYCFKCGKQLPDGSRFCPYCGTGLGEVTQAPASPVQEAPRPPMEAPAAPAAPVAPTTSAAPQAPMNLSLEELQRQAAEDAARKQALREQRAAEKALLKQQREEARRLQEQQLREMQEKQALEAEKARQEQAAQQGYQPQIPPQPVLYRPSETVQRMQIQQLTPAPQKPPKPKKSHKKAIIFGSIGGFFLILLIVFAVFTFPLRGDITFLQADAMGEAVVYSSYTVDGKLSNTRVRVSSNQFVQSVSWAIDPANPDDPAEYTGMEFSGGLYEKSASLADIPIPLGASNLYIRLQTVFGSAVTKALSVEYNIGYLSAPEEYAFIDIGMEGQYLIGNELILVMEEGYGFEDVNDMIEPYGGYIAGQIHYCNEYQIRFSDYGEYFILDMKSMLEGLPGVKSIHTNMAALSGLDLYPNDSEYDGWDTSNPKGNNWGLECIYAPDAWDSNDKMQEVKVGVIDSVVDYRHTDLTIDRNHMFLLPSDYYTDYDMLYERFDNDEWAELDGDFWSSRNHGTHVAGIIGAKGGNNRGVAGVNWKADLYFTTPWFYTDDGSSADVSHYMTPQGLKMALAQMALSGCRVINMSIGSVNPSEVTDWELDNAEYIDQAFLELQQKGCDFLLIKSAGNDGADASSYYWNRVLTTGENAGAHTVVVGAVHNGYGGFENWFSEEILGGSHVYQFCDFSNYGDLVDVTAPGQAILSTGFGDEYIKMSGTSMSAPMVAGIASLIYSINPETDFETAKVILCNSSGYFASKNGVTYSVVSAAKVVKNTQLIDEHSIEQVPVYGYITGSVRDAVTGELIMDSAVIATNEETGEKFNSTNMGGLYEIPLPPGTYTMEFAGNQYRTEIVYGVEITEGNLEYNMALNMVQDDPTFGVAEGRVVDAFDASSIAGAEIMVRPGINNREGDPVSGTISDPDGYYFLELEPGNYTAEVKASGYQSDWFTFVVAPGETLRDQDFTLTPILGEGEARIVLTWGNSPADLDSHLVGPTPRGNTFHTFYNDKDYDYENRNYVNLDVDDTDYYGPETTSIYVGVDGKYTFYVHDFSNRRDPYSTEMGFSEAQVKVYVGGQEPVTFNVPNRAGTLWTVFSLENGVITPINEVEEITIDPDDIGR